jgi:hypothetical protein
MTSPHPMTARSFKVPRNAALLVGLLILIVLGPLEPLSGSALIIELLFASILVGGLYSVGLTARHWIFIALTALTLVTRSVASFSELAMFHDAALALTAIWLATAMWTMIVRLFRQRDVTVDTILGAAVAYLAAAVAFTMLYQWIERAAPGSFTGLPDYTDENPRAMVHSLLYFSLISLTTIGFGDIVPVSEIARPLSALEGAFGQLYLTVIVARLVALHITRQQSSS